MSRIKPHGPVSPHFMNHYYGAAKPAPESDDTTLLRQALEALMSHGAHAPMCDYLVLLTSLPPRRKPCSCGLHDTIAALRERLGEKP